jgi:putative transposase
VENRVWQLQNKEQTTMSKSYQNASSPHVKREDKFTEFLVSNQQYFLPMVELIETSELVIDSLVQTIGRAAVNAVLAISAAQIAGPPHQGARGRGADVVRHGIQQGTVTLSGRKVHVMRPRLRKRWGGSGAEVPIPAYEAMQSDTDIGKRILAVMMRGVSTRNYEALVPDACEATGIKKSSVSRRFIQASARVCEEFAARRFADKRILVIYIDGMLFGDHHIVAAVGIDDAGHKHVLAITQGATENSATVTALLEEMVERGISSDGKTNRLFVIDGAKALRQGIRAVYGESARVQRCRVHKVRNVTEHLPKSRREHAKKVLQAAFRLGGDEGRRRLDELAVSYEKDCPNAAGSLREGLPEMFTIDSLCVSSTLRRSLGSTNIIENPNSGVRRKTGRVSIWKSADDVKRWATTAFVEVESGFRRVQGYNDMWMLDAALNPRETGQEQKEA